MLLFCCFSYKADSLCLLLKIVWWMSFCPFRAADTFLNMFLNPFVVLLQLLLLLNGMLFHHPQWLLLVLMVLLLLLAGIKRSLPAFLLKCSLHSGFWVRFLSIINFLLGNEQLRFRFEFQGFLTLLRMLYILWFNICVTHVLWTIIELNSLQHD